jgi:flagellar basal body-associated protein FliL
MKQKAQIDVLDLPLIEGDELAEDISLETEQPPLQETKSIEKPDRKKLYLIISLSIIAMIAVLAAGYFVFFQKSETKPAAPVAETGKTGEKSLVAVMDGFNVDVKDDKGTSRILSCGFILEMAPHEDGKALEGRLDIRKFIFETLHKRKVGDLIGSDDKKAIKKEIVAGVNGLLGAEKVKDVYITKFVLL